ncbi:MAG: carboxypeptidase-like regulatory domain-containing protein [archaeon]|nr:carboxypeptidase-like regulatory domain-containing protein [archaeon]
MNEDALSPIPILLDPLELGTDGNATNAVLVDVRVRDAFGLGVRGADAILFSPDANGIPLGMKKTDMSGAAFFPNLPAGTYQATGSTPTADGLSPKGVGVVGRTLPLEVKLQTGTALVQVTVTDEFNQRVADANVQVIDASSGLVLGAAITDAQGVAQLAVDTNHTAFVFVSKDLFLPFSSTPFTLLKDNTHVLRIDVSLSSATQQVDIHLDAIYQLNQSGAPVIAQTLVPGQSYAFHYSVRSPTVQQAWQAVKRVNSLSPLFQQTTDVGTVKDGQAAKGSVALYSTASSQDEFAPSNPVSAGQPAKVILNTLGDASSAGAFAFISRVEINPQSIPNQDALSFIYQSKSTTEISPLYQESFTLGAPLPDAGDYVYTFFLAETGTNQLVQVNGAAPIPIEVGKDYSLSYAILNQSGRDYPSASLSFSANPGTFTVSPTQKTLPNFSNNSSQGGSVSLSSTQLCQGNVSYCSTLTITLNGVGSNEQPRTQQLRFYTIPQRQIFLQVAPSSLLPGTAQTIQAVALDQQQKPLLPATSGIQMTGQLLDSSGGAIGNLIPFTSSSSGVFFASIPAAQDGDALHLQADAPGYISGTQLIPVSSDGGINLSQDHACLSISPSLLSFPLGGFGSLTLQTINCREPLQVYTGGFVEGSQIIQLPVRQGANPVNSSSPILMGINDTKVLTVGPAPHIGMYPVYVFAKRQSEPSSAYAFVRNVDVRVDPISPNTQCLNLEKYSFDVSRGSDSAKVVNQCNPHVHDPLFPQVNLSMNGIYAHAIPPVLTPEMRSPNAPISFNWTLALDYQPIINGDWVLDDFPSQTIPDGNWNRFEVAGAPAFLDSKDGFSGSAPLLVSDEVRISNVSYLETQNQTVFPHASRGRKALLFQTTLFLERAFTFPRLCFLTSGVPSVNVRIDGVLVQDRFMNPNCALTNHTLSAGPHTIEYFVYDNDADDYQIRALWFDGSNFRAFSDDQGNGFYLSPEYGNVWSAGNNTNGTQVLGPLPATLTPASSTTQPVYIASLPNSFRDILANKGGVEHLKHSGLRVSTDHPGVRAFVKDGDVFAQYVGFDDPAAEQNVIVENLGMQGEKYGILTLTDYAGLSSPQTNVRLGVVVDASPSVLAKVAAHSPNGVDGICRAIANLQKGMRYYSGKTVDLQVFLMNAPSSFTGASSGASIPCEGILPPNATRILSFSPPVSGDPTESWALAAEHAAQDSFFTQSQQSKLLLIITDNKPSGLSNNQRPSEWDSTRELPLVNAAAARLNANGVKGVVWYMTPLESNPHGLDTGDPNRSDAIALMDYFAASTQGFVEAFDFSERVDTSNNVHAWEQASYNKIAKRLLQHAFDRSSQRIAVKLSSLPPNACIGENDVVGDSGVRALPRILLDWDWNDVDIRACDRASDVSTSNGIFCDGSQFLLSAVKKLHEVENAYAPTANSQQVAQIPFWMNFDAYLMEDAFPSDLRQDFVDYYANSSFADAPSWFKNALLGAGAWKDYVNPSNDRMAIVVNGDPNVNVLPTSGLYRVRMDIQWDSDVGTFFIANTPAARITIYLDLLAASSGMSVDSPLYAMPLDGLIGWDESTQLFHREGYGTTFSGGVVDLVGTSSYPLRTYPSSPGTTALKTFEVRVATDFVATNATAPGELARIDNTTNTLYLAPTLPAPVILDWGSNPFGQGSVFYGIQETDFSTGTSAYISHPNQGTNPLSAWKPIASLIKQPAYGCSSSACALCVDGGGNPFASSIVGDYNPPSTVTGYRAPLNATQLFGFTSPSGISNESFLAGAFYRPAGKDYSIVLGLNDNPSREIGSILTMNTVLQNQGQSTGALDAGDAVLESEWAKAQSFQGMLALLAQDWTCISSEGDSTTIFWNRDKLIDLVKEEHAAYGMGTNSSTLVGNACVATGNPLGRGGTYTLQERAGNIPNSQNVLGLCPLYSNSPQVGAYLQLGIPYPVGTQIHLPPTQTTPNTGDPLDRSVQYRYSPTNCGAPTSVKCPSSPDYCANDGERYWVGIPNLQP